MEPAMMSPARAAGLVPRFPDTKVCWSQRLVPFRVWDKVCQKTDRRHVGEVKAVYHTTVIVHWENGWISELKFNELEKA
jgi:hypothetical protein